MSMTEIQTFARCDVPTNRHEYSVLHAKNYVTITGAVCSVYTYTLCDADRSFDAGVIPGVLKKKEGKSQYNGAERSRDLIFENF